MNKNYLIGVGVLIIAIVAGVSFYIMGVNSAQPTQIEIFGNGTIEEGGSLNIQLSSLNGTSISGKKLKVVISNSKGKKVLDRSLNTNTNGKISVNLDNLSSGKYNVNVSFSGDDKYLANNTSDKIKIKEKEVVIESTPEEVTQTVPESEPSESESRDFQTPLDDDPYVVEYDEYHGVSENIKYYTYDDGSVVAISDNGHYLTQYADGSMDSGYI